MICELMTSIMQQNCQIIERLIKKTWRRGWVVLVMNSKWQIISLISGEEIGELLAKNIARFQQEDNSTDNICYLENIFCRTEQAFIS